MEPLKLPILLGLALKKEGGSSNDWRLQMLIYFYSIFKKFEQVEIFAFWGLLGVVFGLDSHELAMGDKVYHIRSRGAGLPFLRNQLQRGSFSCPFNQEGGGLQFGPIVCIPSVRFFDRATLVLKIHKTQAKARIPSSVRNLECPLWLIGNKTLALYKKSRWTSGSIWPRGIW